MNTEQREYSTIESNVVIVPWLSFQRGPPQIIRRVTSVVTAAAFCATEDLRSKVRIDGVDATATDVAEVSFVMVCNGRPDTINTK
jgi:hypothetical protein